MHVFRISIEFTTKGAVVNARVFNNIHVDSFLFLFANPIFAEIRFH